MAAMLYGFAASSMAIYLPPPQEVLEMIPEAYPSTTVDNTVDPCSLADSPRANASVQLASWLECQINAFYPFPANADWAKGHASAFSKDLRFSFNDTHYDFGGSFRLYQSFNTTLGKAFAPFKHGFINTLGIPNANGDRGGFVYMIGWAGGYQTRAKRDLYFTNAAFAVVREERDGDGIEKRKIVEFRESSNIPNTAHLPEQTVWDCHFPKENLELKRSRPI